MDFQRLSTLLGLSLATAKTMAACSSPETGPDGRQSISWADPRHTIILDGVVRNYTDMAVNEPQALALTQGALDRITAELPDLVRDNFGHNANAHIDFSSGLKVNFINGDKTAIVRTPNMENPFLGLGEKKLVDNGIAVFFEGKSAFYAPQENKVLRETEEHIQVDAQNQKIYLIRTLTTGEKGILRNAGLAPSIDGM